MYRPSARIMERQLFYTTERPAFERINKMPLTHRVKATTTPAG